MLNATDCNIMASEYARIEKKKESLKEKLRQEEDKQELLALVREYITKFEANIIFDVQKGQTKSRRIEIKAKYDKLSKRELKAYVEAIKHMEAQGFKVIWQGNRLEPITYPIEQWKSAFIYTEFDWSEPKETNSTLSYKNLDEMLRDIRKKVVQLKELNNKAYDIINS